MEFLILIGVSGFQVPQLQPTRSTTSALKGEDPIGSSAVKTDKKELSLSVTLGSCLESGCLARLLTCRFLVCFQVYYIKGLLSDRRVLLGWLVS